MRWLPIEQPIEPPSGQASFSTLCIATATRGRGHLVQVFRLGSHRLTLGRESKPGTVAGIRCDELARALTSSARQEPPFLRTGVCAMR
jgi:hypothetical protein